MYCVVEWQRVIDMLRVLCGGVAACYKFGACNVWWCATPPHSTRTIPMTRCHSTTQYTHQSYRYDVCIVCWCGSVLLVRCVYCAVVMQRIIIMVCVLYGGVAACNMYGVCTVWRCGSVSYV